MIPDSLINQVRQKMQFAGIKDKRIVFEIEDEGKILINTHEVPYEIEETETDDYDVKMRAKMSVFEGILTGTQDPNMAFMMGKLKVDGSTGLAMKLASVLED
jgi:putative sterol carrier protein